MIGIEMDPAHSVYVTTDGERIYADMYYRSPRYDTRSSASRAKYRRARRLLTAGSCSGRNQPIRSCGT